MKKVGVFAISLILITGALVSAQEKILVGGTSGMIPMMQDVAKAYQARNPSERVEVLTGSLDSTGGIQAVAAGRIHIGLTGRTLRPEEQGKVLHRFVGRMPMVVAVHKDVPVSTLTEAQVCGIYAGTIKSWKEVGGGDSKIVVLTRSDLDSSTKETFRKGIRGAPGTGQAAAGILDE